jgi:alpha-beta hydrolase superfamily lysophospholipase
MNKESKIFLTLAMAMGAVLLLSCAERSASGSQPAATNLATPVLTVAPAASPPQDNAPRIEVAELKALVARNEVLILDVRSPDSYKASHAKGAISYPLDWIEKGDLKDLPKDKRIVAYCT